MAYDPQRHDVVIGIGRLAREQRIALTQAGYEPLVALGDRPVWVRSSPHATVLSLDNHRVSDTRARSSVPLVRRHR